MLVLTRHVGQSIRIGDGVRLTIRSKLRAHLTVTLTAPEGVSVIDDTDTVLSPADAYCCFRRYEIAAFVGDSLRIGQDVVVWFGTNPRGGWLGLWRGRETRVGIDAPRAVPVHREEVYRRIRRGEPYRAAEAI